MAQRAKRQVNFCSISFNKIQRGKILAIQYYRDGLGICGRELLGKPAVSQVVLPGAAHGLDAAPVVAVVCPPHELCVVTGGALPLLESLTGRNPAARPAAVGGGDLVAAPLVPLAQLLGDRNKIL